MHLTADELSILVRARELLLDPGHCVFGVSSCDDSGNHLKPGDPRATHWDILGAIARFSPNGLISYNTLRHVDECIKVLEPVLTEDFTFEVLYDQTFTHERIVEFLDLMLARASNPPIPSVGSTQDL